MKILYGPDFCFNEPMAVTIGKFDGVHEGHIKIINNLIDVSKKYKIKNVVYTFDKNPKIVLNHDNFLPLMSNDEKSYALERLGIDYLVYEKFDENFSNLTPERFVKDILINKLNVRAIIMGENSTFGKERSGDLRLMKDFGKKYGFDVYSVELIRKNGEVISSSSLRKSCGMKILN